MLLNRSKIHNAKVKISELKQKYSTKNVLRQNERTNELIEPDEKNINKKDVHFALNRRQNKITQSDSSSKNTSTITEHNLASKQYAFPNKMMEQEAIQASSLEIKESTDLPQIESNVRNSKYGSMSLSSGDNSLSSKEIELSDEMSQVVNQLDNLCFISSSSNENMETITELSSPGRQQNLIEMTKGAIDEIQMLPKNGDSSKQGNSYVRKINDLFEQYIPSDTGSSVSSRSKIMSEHGSLEYQYSNTFTDDECEASSGNVTLSNLESLDIVEVNNKSIASEDSIQRISNTCTRENIRHGLGQDEKKLKRCKAELLNYKDTSLSCDKITNKKLDVENILNKQNYIRQFCSKHNKELICPNSVILKAKAHGDRRKEGTRKCKTENVDKLFCQTNTSVKLNTGFNPAAKRPVLRSSKLIKHTVPQQGTFGFPEKAAIITKNTEELDCPDTPHTGHQECEQIINNLLLNQIQLTRHFIDSHHKMYLLCCKAAQNLSKVYARQHGFSIKKSPG